MISGPWPLYFAFISALPTVFTELWCMGPAPGCMATEASLEPLHWRDPEVEGCERDKGFRRSRSQHETDYLLSSWVLNGQALRPRVSYTGAGRMGGGPGPWLHSSPRSGGALSEETCTPRVVKGFPGHHLRVTVTGVSVNLGCIELLSLGMHLSEAVLCELGVVNGWDIY